MLNLFPKQPMKNIIVILAALFFSCSDKNNLQPSPDVFLPVKSTGNHSKPFTSPALGYQSIDAAFKNGGQTLVISTTGEPIGIIFTISDFFESASTIKIHKNISGNSEIYYNNQFSISAHITDSFNIGYVTFSDLNRINSIVSNTFYFDVWDIATKETVDTT